MKNVFVYYSIGQLTQRTKNLIKCQIDNSLELGWKKEDIIILSNGEFEYQGIKNKWNKFFVPSIIKNRLVKPFIVSRLWDIIDDDCFIHDLDAFQVEKFDFPGKDLALATYGYRELVQGGVFFVARTGKDILDHACDLIVQRVSDEQALTETICTYSERCKILDTSYNLGTMRFEERYEKAELPIKVVHFRPDTHEHWLKMLGRNTLNVCVLNARIVSLLFKYRCLPEK